MDEQDSDDPYAEYLTYEFILIESDEKDNSIQLTCNPSRKLTLDEYIEALKQFISQHEVSEEFAAAQRGPGDLLN
jgi:hypothetical protein